MSLVEPGGSDGTADVTKASAEVHHAAVDYESGVPVTSHRDLVTYLKERGGPSAQVDLLPLVGANTVVYRLYGANRHSGLQRLLRGWED